MENNQSAARAAKRFLDDRIRNDWAYPQLPASWEHSDEEVRTAVDFRERYYGESESSDSDIEPSTGASKDVGTQEAAYKFDSPDAIGDAVERTREKRRKRRRMRLEEEMAENEGLRIWVQRRDAWTGASSVRKYGARPAKPPPAAVAQHDSGNGAEDTMQLDPTPPRPTSASSETAVGGRDTFDVVPVAPRLLADNPIRASINPKAYSDIYAKIVTSSRTPSVPINLSDINYVDGERVVQASHLRSDIGFGTTLAVREETMQISARQQSRDDTAYPGLIGISTQKMTTPHQMRMYTYGSPVMSLRYRTSKEIFAHHRHDQNSSVLTKRLLYSINTSCCIVDHGSASPDKTSLNLNNRGAIYKYKEHTAT
ncbi:hypothetical protein E8E11_003113 [Didymella keratinophila]|nr:hypothetical protein E8E11_003113 [Didymella keratinophila]